MVMTETSKQCRLLDNSPARGKSLAAEEGSAQLTTCLSIHPLQDWN